MTVSDKKQGVDSDQDGVVDYYEAEVTSANDYYPFGWSMPGRKFNSGDYRFGFNGMERDDELKGEGNSYTTHFRQLDPRIGKWLSIDPVIHEGMSPYNFADNNPILVKDPSGADGEEPDRNQAGTIGEATKQWCVLKNPTVNSILSFVQQDPNAVRYVYTKKSGWIDLQHYFGTLKYGEFQMDLLELASGNEVLQALIFGEGADGSYYSYEDLPTNKEATNSFFKVTEFSSDPMKGRTLLEGDQLIESVSEHIENLGATEPEMAPNWNQIPFKDKEKDPNNKLYRERLPRKIAVATSSKRKKHAMAMNDKIRDLLKTGNYIPQNRSEKPYDLNDFPAAPTSIDNGDDRKGATGH